MRLRFNRWVTAVAVAAAVLMVGGSAKAAEPTETLQGKNYSLHLYQLHTGESLDVVYRVGDTYIPEALDKLNHFLRDYRTDTVKTYDPKEFDVLHSLMAKLRRPNGVIDIVCGYRTPETNHFLRTRAASTGVAEHSQHIAAKAIDIRVPGVSTVRLRNAALSLHEGGVGYYPTSQFVHVDVGPVREWSYGRVRSRHRHSRTRVRALGE
ncbi:MULTISPECIES: DUF882 domain-containing protein [Acidobacteriaceae]|uniref:DUF882 domain-containing protein n=1 Tax=Acidobacteriaceae TaxID=204434 RepID=UPI00131D6754|nr:MULTISPECIES: DUF882 domain-containing protein [Acidobacteriaceae]MDW5264839.1 DUF882 domain-containing protein [Edaphobacter sp.]